MDDDAIDRALESIGRERTLDRLDPTNPECPGCGRRERADMLTFPTNLLTGVMLLCCAECCDDESADMSLDEYRADLVANWNPLGHMAIGTRYRGVMLPPNFYDGIQVN